MKTAARKVCLTSLGCPKNLVDSEVMLGFLTREGYEITTDEAEADILVVNTCGFIADAKRESVEAILRLAEFKKSGRCGALVVAGCLPQRYKDEISRILPEVDLFIGTGEYHRIAELVANAGRGEVFAGKPLYIHDHDTPRILATPRHYAYLKISDGCSNHCTYCTIPMIRGELRSRTFDSIVKEAEFLVSAGVKEINIVSNDTTSYGRDLKYKDGLPELLRRLAKIKGKFWIRLLYLYPDRISDSLIRLIKDEEKICKYIEMPIQHINDRLLKAMGRTYGRRLVESLIDKLRKSIAGVVLRTTLITGFPSETEEEFRELLEFVRAAEFERLGVFAYSREKETAAGRMRNQVAEEVKRERLDKIMEAQAKISLKKNRMLKGKRFDVLIEESAGNGHFKGRIAGQAPEIDGVTYVRCENAQPGDFISALITGADEYDLLGRGIRGKI